MTDWKRVLRAVSSRASSHVLAQICPRLDDEFERTGITTPLRQAHFLARAAVETDGFTTLEERGGVEYFTRMYDIRGKRPAKARELGNTKPGDGARYHGRGVFDDTGRANYAIQSKRRGVDLVAHPELAATGPIAVANAVDFWTRKHLNAAADRDDARGVCIAINGGTNGLKDQMFYLGRAKRALAAEQARPAAAEGIADLPPAIPAVAGEEPRPRPQIEALQQRLADLNYSMVGKADGLIGAGTTAAISAFQHDNELPTTGRFDPDTITAIWSGMERPISDDRASEVPEGSRIFDSAKSLKRAAIVAAGGGLTTDVGGWLDQAQTVKGYWDRVSDLAAPFAPAKALLFSHPGLFIAAGAIAVLGVAWHIQSARTEDHQRMKTP